MPSKYTVNGVDLDTIFKARSSVKRADIGIKVGGVDISNRYEPTNGSDQITTNTDIKTNNTDLRYVFQKYDYTPPVTSANYLIISYDWTAAAGSDLDTRTTVVSPVTTTTVGFKLGNNQPPYIYWAGDNVSDVGPESAYIDLSQFDNTSVVKVKCAAFWYEWVGTGTVTLRVQAYSGGTITRADTIYANSTGTLQSNNSINYNITLWGSSNADGPGQLIRYVNYNKNNGSITFSTI